MKQKLQSLLARGETHQAIQELLVLTKQQNKPGFHQEVILQAARLEKYTKSKEIGTASLDDQVIHLTKINESLLSIIERLFGEGDSVITAVVEGSDKEAPLPVEGKTWWKYLSMAAVVIGILGSLAEVFGFMDVFSAADESTATLTVYVHGPGGVQDYVLENEGELLLDFNGDRRYAKIGEKGRTVFNEIPMKFRGQGIPIAVKAKGYEAVGSQQYYSWEGEVIYYAIQKDRELGKIKGIVKSSDSSQFLADVLILIDNEFTTTTDSLGRFFYQMESHRIKDKYSLSFQKEGYQSASEFYYPPATPEFRLKKQ